MSALNTPDIFVSPSTIEAILGPKMRSMSSTVYSRVFDHVVQQCRHDGFHAESDLLDDDLGHGNGMQEIRLAGRRRTPS